MPARNAPAPVTSKAKVFLVEDHPITRDGLSQLVNYQDDLQICGTAGTAASAKSGIELARPDLIVVDVSLPDGHGIELVKDLRAIHPKLPVLVLSMHDEALYAERAFRAGASGYIMKQEPTDVILSAMRRLLRGETYLSAKMQARVVLRFATGATTPVTSDIEKLSDRELEVFELLGKGRSTNQIAQQLRLSVSTVETYRAHLKEKLQLKSASELIHRAVEWANQR
jgi:DNA-binding NarL/FixJ family response regulator